MADLRGPLKVIHRPGLPPRDANEVMDELRRLSADTSMAPISRMGAGRIVIGNWAAEAGEDHAERRRRLETLDNEVARMATTDDFWRTMRDVIRRNT